MYEYALLVAAQLGISCNQKGSGNEFKHYQMTENEVSKYTSFYPLKKDFVGWLALFIRGIT